MHRCCFWSQSHVKVTCTCSFTATETGLAAFLELSQVKVSDDRYLTKSYQSILSYGSKLIYTYESTSGIKWLSHHVTK